MSSSDLLVEVQEEMPMGQETVIQVVRPRSLNPKHSGDGSGEAGAKKHYYQKFRTLWMEEPMFHDWLIPVPDDPYSAGCSSCATSMKAHRKLLIEHYKSKKHQSQRGRRNPNFTPRPAARRGRRRTLPTDPPGSGRFTHQLASPQKEEEEEEEELELDVSYNDAGRVTYSIGLGSQRVGFVGSGSMAQALGKGMLDKGLVVPGRITVSATSDRNFELWRRWGCRTTTDNNTVFSNSDIIFLAVRPADLETVFSAVALEDCDPARCVISLVSGVSRLTIRQLLASRQSRPSTESIHVVRCQANTPLRVGEGCCVYAAGADLPHHWLLSIETVFSALGLFYRVEERLIDAAAGAFSSGPAFVHSFVEALTAGAVNMGMPWHLARPMAAQTVLGAARMLIDMDSPAGELRDNASAPGGPTLSGLMALEKAGLKYAVMSAVQAASQRSAQLGQDSNSIPDPPSSALP